MALETKQILQVLSEQRNGGIANPQLACGLLLFGQELPGESPLHVGCIAAANICAPPLGQSWPESHWALTMAANI